MSNYSERLGEIIRKLCHDFENRKVDSLQTQVDAKQAFTSLTKELVAEAKKNGFYMACGLTGVDESRVEELWDKCIAQLTNQEGEKQDE